MPDLLAGTTVFAEDFPPAVFGEELTNIENFASTTFAAPSTPLEITFTASTTGRTKIDIRAEVDADSVASGINGDIQVRESNSSGTVVYSPQTNSGIDRYWVNDAPANELESGWTYLSGLTPGQTYWVQLQFQATDAAKPIDIAHQALLATPLP